MIDSMKLLLRSVAELRVSKVDSDHFPEWEVGGYININEGSLIER